jgi:hypothetical protein
LNRVPLSKPTLAADAGINAKCQFDLFERSRIFAGQGVSRTAKKYSLEVVSKSQIRHND